jgi:nickel-dependent lactate racemase
MAKVKLEIGYGQEKVPVEIDEERLAGVYLPNKVEEKDETVTLRKALENPVGTDSFEKFLEGDGKILVIVNDGTRPTPTAKVLDILGDELEKKSPDYIIATGSHRAPTEEEYQFIFGRFRDQVKDRIHIHQAKESECIPLGKSSAGTEMEVNKLGVDADKIMIIGSVEPHYFSGYTGGRKAYLPGIASFKTIEQNHKYALLPAAKALALKGNPVHEDMIDALKVVKDKAIFSIQCVLDSKRRIYEATAGDIHQSFDAAIAPANKVFCVEIPSKEDIVLSVAPYPMEVDLYQSQKCLDNAKLALNDGGILIMVATCRTGIGGKSFFDLLSSQDSPDKVLGKIDEGYKLGYHKAAKMAEIMCTKDIWAITELPPEELEKIFIKSKPSIQQALDDALAAKPGGKVIVLPEGSMTVPLIKG